MRRNKLHLFGLFAMVALAATIVVAQAPAWWTNRGVINTNAVARDFAPVNQGPVKWLATQAAAEFNENLPLFTQKIPAGLWSDLKAQGLLHPDAPVPA